MTYIVIAELMQYLSSVMLVLTALPSRSQLFSSIQLVSSVKLHSSVSTVTVMLNLGLMDRLDYVSMLQ